MFFFFFELINYKNARVITTKSQSQELINKL